MEKVISQIFKLLLPALFVAILVIPFVNDQLNVWEFERRDENRVFHDSLSIDYNKLDYFPGAFEDYLNDNFSFRTPLLNLYHTLKFSYFKVSPHPDKTIVGGEDWYFNAGKERSIVEGKMDFSKETLKALSAEWKRRKEYLDSAGIKYYWIIAPTKHSVYPEKLPFNVYQSGTRRVDKLTEYLKAPFPKLIIDPVAEMKKVRDTTKLYYKLDNHWSIRSGYLVTQMLIDAIRQDLPNADIKDLSNYEWKDSVTHAGIHYDVLGLEELSEKREYPVMTMNSVEDKKYGFPSVKGFAYPWEFERRFTNSGQDSGLKVLFIRDSFGEQMFPFVRESFKESVFIFDAWQYKLNKSIIEKVQPDVVVFLTLETHIGALTKTYE